MSELSKRKLRIDNDEQEMFKISDHRTQIHNKTQKKLDETSLKSKELSKNRQGHYRPSRMSDSFMPSEPTIHETISKKEKKESLEIELPTHIFDIEEDVATPYIGEKRALDEPVQIQKKKKTSNKKVSNKKVSNQKERNKKGRSRVRETADVTAGLDQQELRDYMRKNQTINRLMVSFIVALIVIGAIVVIIFLVMNLRRAGQTSPLGGV